MDYYDARDFLLEPSLTSNECDISKFFDGTTVFITGSTGFIGNLILEKLLRCCPGVKQVYILVRVKKGKSEQERMHELFRNDVFFTLWKKDPDFVKKVNLISGDCSEPNLGISLEDKKQLMSVNVIFHSAASLQFDEHLRNSFHANVCATRDLLELAKQMKNLKGFTYVSTAFSQVDVKVLKEEFYEPKYNFTEIKAILDNFTDDEISKLMPLLLGNATTYSFTKSIAEDLVKQYKEHLPIGVVRPSIVINTYTEPLKNWINGINGHSAIIVGILLGILRVLKVSSSSAADLIPADKVASAIISCTWDYATNKPLHPVYNVASCMKCRTTWFDIQEYIRYFGNLHHVASKFSLWMPFVWLIPCPILYKILVFFLHVIPALFIDLALKMKGKKLRLMRLYRKATYLWQLMDIYTKIEWTFEDDNLYRVWEIMKPNDKRIFNFSLKNFDWKDYMCHYMNGLQVYIVKESLDYDKMMKARRHRKVLTICHNGVITLFIVFASWIILSQVAKLIGWSN